MRFLNIYSALLIYLCAVASLFLREKQRGIFLLLLSVVLLVTWGGPTAFAIAVTQTLLAWAFAFGLRPGKRIFTFWLFLLLELAPLFYFKISGMSAGAWNSAPSWIVPVGISFYTFQILSYLIEIQFGRLKPERNPFLLASYVLFFGNKIAGPIERPSLMEQLRSPPTPEAKRVLRGAICVWFGLFQKFVLADHLADYVNPVFSHPANYAGLTDTIAVLLSKYQIFCDFSGISLMAVGLGDIFGLELTRNFNRPFAALSLRDFWRRWHISLQSWIRDYVFYPSLSTPLARWGLTLPLALAFVLFGLWHDLRWTFAIYGLIQVALIRIDFGKSVHRFAKPALILFNYAVLICLPSILFRSETLSQAWQVFHAIGWNAANWSFFTALGDMKLHTLVFFGIANEGWMWMESRFDVYDALLRVPWIVKIVLSLALLVLLILFAKFDPDSVFIYSRY